MPARNDETDTRPCPDIDAPTPPAELSFTVVACRRQPILCDEPVRRALREAIEQARSKHPFTIDAWVLLPDHLHCISTLPADDGDFPKRWSIIITRLVSPVCAAEYKRTDWINASKKQHRESTLWQRRYRGRQIRDDEDFQSHIDYIHYNPVKHGLCAQPDQWPHLTVHRYIREGRYPENWGAQTITFDGDSYGE